MKSSMPIACRRYTANLRRHVAAGRSRKTSTQPDAGLTTRILSLAKAHEHAVAAYDASRSGRAMTSRADAYFGMVITGIVGHCHVTSNASTKLDVAHDQLHQRTRSLALAKAHLHRVVGQRTRAESELSACREHYSRLKQESDRLQRGLRLLTHQAINAQEIQNGRISRVLRNNIAQTLLGINVRLQALKMSTKNETADLISGITAVQKSAQSPISLPSTASRD